MSRGAFAIELEYERVIAFAKILSSPGRLFDYTLPIASLLAFAKLTGMLRELFRAD